MSKHRPKTERDDVLLQRLALAERRLDDAMERNEKLTEELQVAHATIDKLSGDLTHARNFQWRQANARAWGHH
jgi:hypothetical protein